MNEGMKSPQNEEPINLSYAEEITKELIDRHNPIGQREFLNRIGQNLKEHYNSLIEKSTHDLEVSQKNLSCFLGEE